MSIAAKCKCGKNGYFCDGKCLPMFSDEELSKIEEACLNRVTGETPIQEEETGEREEIVWDEVIHFYNSGDPLEDNHCSMIRQLMNKYELKRK